MLKLSSEEVELYYHANKNALGDVSLQAFTIALAVAETHFRHELANANHARKLLARVNDELKAEVERLEQAVKEMGLKI